MIGISKHKAIYHYSAESFKNEFSKTLSKLIGKKIDRYWLMWKTDNNEWETEEPVILEIEGNRYEFTASQHYLFSLTINSFELTDELNWFGEGKKERMFWKENKIPKMTRSLNKTIVGINILIEKIEDLESETLIGIEFILKKESKSDKENSFSIYNNLDENAINNVETEFLDQIKRIKIIQ